MKIISADKVITSMSINNSPIEYVEAGEIVKIRTLDCFSNRLRREEQVLSNLPWDSINPCTGPIYIKGAEKGDILKISILDISVDDQGVLIKDKGDLKKYGLNEKEKSLYAAVVNDEIVLSDEVKIPISPMIGVIGTAAEKDILTTLPGEHGGNMDNKMIKKGSIIYLPVFHEGALLSIGDLHASMGDGEAAGCGIEISGSVTIQIDVEKNANLPVPMVMADGKVCMIASAESLDKAAEKSVKMMLDYLNYNCKMNSDISWKLLAAVGDVKICQFANKIKTVRCEMPQKYLRL